MAAMALALLAGVPLYSYAQTNEGNPNLESCFAHYDYGNVAVQLSADMAEYHQGDVMMLRGIVSNNNTFPLHGVMLYAQLRRINDADFSDNGHYLVDQFVVKENLYMLPGEDISIESAVPVKKTYPDGAYRLQYYVLSPEGFNYAGRTFLEEDVAGTTDIALSGFGESLVYFDISHVTVNGVSQKIRGSIVEFDTSTVDIRVPVIDSRTEKTPLQTTVRVHRFQDAIPGQIVSESKETISDGVLLYRVNTPGRGSYVVTAEINDPQQTQFKYRFATTAGTVSDLRLNDLGVSDFPVLDTSNAWVCFHSPTNDTTDKTTVVLSVFDQNNRQVDSKQVSDMFSPEVSAISIPLTSLADKQNFRIQAQVLSGTDNHVIKTVSKQYNCSMYGASLRDFSVTYDAGNQVVQVKGTDGCGAEVQDKTIHMFRVTDSAGSLVHEETYISLPYEYHTGNLMNGHYNAEVRIGDETKTASFEKTQGMVVSKKKDILIYIAVGVVVLGLTGAYIAYRRGARANGL